MVEVRVHRHAIQVLAKTPVQAGVSRQEIEVAVQDDGTGEVRVHRHAVEVLGKLPAIAQVSRQEIEAAVQDEGTGEVRVHRHGVEVLFKAPAKAAVSRQEIEAAVQDDGTGEVHIHRHAIQVLARVGVAAPVPLAFPAGLDFFLQNWVQNITMETGYQTTISRSPTTLAEERIALSNRPYRQLDLLLTHDGKDDIDRLMHHLRRHTARSLPVPLLQDVVADLAGTTGQDMLTGSFQYRRFFNGGRVVIFPANPTSKSVMRSADYDIYLIVDVLAGSMQLDRNLDQNYVAGEWMIAPLIDMELVLETGIDQLTDDTAETKLTLNEAAGQSAMPPTFTGNNVDGWQTQLGLPVFEFPPDWQNGLSAAYKRYGQRRVEGRANVVVPQGDRYVQVQDFHLKLDRPAFWAVLNLFDSRRGRTDLFWEIDQEFLWTVTDTDPQFIDVTPRGIFADFVSDFTDHCGILMKDGTVYIRKINSIADVGSWRISLVAGNDLPDPIDVTQIERFSRARMKRFDSDALREEWHTTEQAEVSFITSEVLNEKEVDI